MDIIQCPFCNGQINVNQKIHVVSSVGEVPYHKALVKLTKTPVIDKGIKPLTEDIRAIVLKHISEGWKKTNKKQLAKDLGIRSMQIAGVIAGMKRKKNITKGIKS